MTRYYVAHLTVSDSCATLVYSTTDLDFATAVARRTADRGGAASVAWRDADAWHRHPDISGEPIGGFDTGPADSENDAVVIFAED